MRLSIDRPSHMPMEPPNAAMNVVRFQMYCCSNFKYSNEFQMTVTIVRSRGNDVLAKNRKHTKRGKWRFSTAKIILCIFRFLLISLVSHSRSAPPVITVFKLFAQKILYKLNTISYLYQRKFSDFEPSLKRPKIANLINIREAVFGNGSASAPTVLQHSQKTALGFARRRENDTACIIYCVCLIIAISTPLAFVQMAPLTKERTISHFPAG